MLSEWCRCVLSDIADVVDSLHQTPAYRSTGLPMVRVTDIKGGYLALDQSVKVDNQTFDLFVKNHKPQQGDIVISRVGSYGNFSYVATNEPFCLGQNTAIIVPHINSRFLYYSLISNITKQYIEKIVTGSTQKTISLKDIKAIPVLLPEREEQEKISSVLTAIDEEIEINKKINDNLLQQAMTLFVHTFIDDPPCGESRPLYDFADYINGAAFKQDDYSASGLPIIKIAELKNGITDSTQFFAGDKGEKYLIHDKDILFSWSGNPDTSIDIFIWASGDAILNQHTFNVKSKEGFRWFVYLMLKYFKPQFTQIASNKQTTGLGHVTATDLKRLTFIYDRDKIASFEETIEPTMEMMFNNILENRSLISLRDFLLPRLMSGEIDVSSVTA